MNNSSETFLCPGWGHRPQSDNAIAKKHGCYLVNHTELGGAHTRRHWFACPRVDDATAQELEAALARDLGIPTR